MKKAFITGITGQDGSYLAELLLEKGYQVVGLISRKYNIGYQNVEQIKEKLILEKGDLLDENSLKVIIKKYLPDEIYNLGGITFIPQSWEEPELTFDVNALGLLRILKLIKEFSPQSRLYQATSAKIFGNPQAGPQNEQTAVQPLTPYAVSKTCAHFLTQNFREHFGIFACSGILYNHESERRGPEFVTRKISLTAAKIKLGQAKKLILGNLKAQQDWGYAPDYVEAMWLMLQQKKADDYVIASGQLHSVKDVCQTAFASLHLDWRQYVEYDKKLTRKEEADNFLGDASKAKKKLGWQPKISFKEMIERMVKNDLKLVKKGAL
jgi:GDPmannose 4,6-dehydratase